MTEIVVDASVAALWLAPPATPGAVPAQALLEQYEAGHLSVVVPPLLFLELLNIAGRRWRWAEAALIELATRLEGMLTDVVDPDLGGVAVWTARGLTAYDATYVTLAQERGIRLLTKRPADPRCRRRHRRGGQPPVGRRRLTNADLPPFYLKSGE